PYLDVLPGREGVALASVGSVTAEPNELQVLGRPWSDLLGYSRLVCGIDPVDVTAESFPHAPRRPDPPIEEKDPSPANGLHRREVVCDEEKRPTVGHEPRHPLHALGLEASISHSQGLVHHEDVG